MKALRTPLVIAALLVTALAWSTPAPVAAAPSGASAGLPRASAVALSAGTGHACAVLDTGEVKCWGNNNSGRLGQGHTTNWGTAATHMGNNLPRVLLPAGRTVKEVAAGGAHTCALLDNGAVHCWGSNGTGELGDGTNVASRTRPSTTPVNLGAGRTALTMSAGLSHTCAVLDDGTLRCWGNNFDGQLGRGSTGGTFNTPGAPVNLGAGRTARAVAAGQKHTCALLDNGTVKCWGNNLGGQLGTGGVSPLNAPPTNAINLGAGRSALGVDVGDQHTCALLDNGTVKCWGYNGSGQLGLGNFDQRTSPPASPINLGAGRTAKAVAAGGNQSCAILDNNTLKCWGGNTAGQLGDGTKFNRPAPLAGPVILGAGRTARAVTTEFTRTCALLDDGTVKCWGANATGQLGVGDTSERLDPPAAPIDLGTRRLALRTAVGENFTCAVYVGGTVACWGWNPYGQLGDGTHNNVRLVPPPDPINLGPGRTATDVQAGRWHACALLDNGTVKCWGENVSGQLGTGDNDRRYAPPANPVNLGAGRTAKAISMNRNTSCALLDNGTVRCWGFGMNGELGTGSYAAINTPGAVVNLGLGRTARAISSGSAHTCALLDNDSVKCWGSNLSGQLGLGNTSSSVSTPTNAVDFGVGRIPVAVSTGGANTCAILDNGTLRCWGQNNTGQTGNGATGSAVLIPAEINLGVGRTALRVDVGGNHTCAILDDTTTKCWGYGASGRLATGSQDNQPSPITANLGTGRRAAHVEAGITHTCVTFDVGSVKCFGEGDSGGLGYGDASPRGATGATVGDNLPVLNLGGSKLLVFPQPFRFVPLNPARVLDTRSSGQTVDGQAKGQGLRAAGTVTELQVSGRAGVPVGASAVVVNLTVSGAQAAGFITAYPCGTTRPNASNLNYTAGQTVANLAVVKIGAGGKVCLYNESPTQLLADVTGYQPFHTGYAALNPARLLDTRGSGTTVDGQSQGGGPRPARDVVTVQVAGRGGVPAGTIAVVLNVTVSGPQANGFVTVYPCGPSRPNTSNLNYRAGQTVANLVVVRLDTQGRVCLYTEAAAQLIADVAGAHPVADPLVALTPARLLDTRPNGQTVDGQGRFTAPRPAGSVTEVQITGRAGVPGNATTAIVNLTATGAQANGFVTAFPCGTSRPLTSSLNHRAGQTVPNLAIVKIGTGGKICLYTEATTHLLADITAAY